MRALLTVPPGGWSNTNLADVDLPAGRDDQALIEIHAVGLNPADNYLILGQYPGGPKPPFTVGRDAAGVVQKGDAAGRWKPGDRVVVLQSTTTDLQQGTLCERRWIAAENLAPQPANWTDAEAAAAPLAYLTAWKALIDIGGLQPGQTVVITGASGGVGLAAVQLASAYGAKVVALSRAKDKRQRLLSAGAQFVFSPEEPHLKQAICGALQVDGVNLVVENVGGASLGTSVHLLDVHGRVSVVGVLAGVESTIPIPALMFKRASIHGVLVTDDPPERAQRRWSEVVEIMDRAGRRPIVDSEFPLDQAAAAFDKLRQNVFGKVVVRVGSR